MPGKRVWVWFMSWRDSLNALFARIAEYLNVVLEKGSETEIVTAIGHIAKAIGMTKNNKINRNEQTKFMQSFI